jgi:MFS family permease
MKPTNKVIYLVMSIWLMLMMGAVYTYSVFRPYVENTFTLNTLQSGLPYMASLFFYALSMMITGRLLKHTNTSLIMTIGLLLIGAGWFIAGSTESFIIFVISYGWMIGTGVGMVYGIPIRGIQDVYPLRKGFYMGIVLLGFGLSTLIVAPVSTFLIDRYGFSQTLHIYGYSFLVMLLPFVFLIRPIKPMELEVKNNLSFQQSLSITGRRLYIYFVFSTTIGLMMIGLSYYIGVSVYQFDAWKIAFSMSLFAIMNGIARPIFGWLMDKKGFTFSTFISLGLIMIASIISMINRGTHLALFMISYGLFWFNLGAWLAIIPAAVRMKYEPSEYSKRYGLIFTGYGIGAIIGTLLSGFIMDIFGDTLYIYLMILLIVGFLFLQTFQINKKATV